MNLLEIHLENCYGIKRLKHAFNFNESKAHLIYAPNGVMKSSFANTMEDIAEKRNSKDRIFPNRIVHRSVQVDGREIEYDEVFVIQRMNNSDFREASTILANEKLKNEYDKINNKLVEERLTFFKQLQPYLGIKVQQIESTIEDAFRMSFFEFMKEYGPQVNQVDAPLYTSIIYAEIFNDKAINFLQSKDFKNRINEYVNTYEDLVAEQSSFFKKGTFNHYNADTITKSLKDNNFFSANHKVKVKDIEIGDAVELEELIKQEKERVLKSPELSTKFNEIDKALNANAELRKFRSYIEINQDIIKEFIDLNNFKQKLLINYIAQFKSEFNVLLKLHEETNAQRKKIITEAQKEQEDWKGVIEIFKRRFTVPFQVHIKNQEGVILNSEPASLLFEYSDGDGPENKRRLGGAEIYDTLSTGEQRVFYLLNIIFQIEIRKKSNKKQLVIVDDIADSFDYKNKYAIIEYLKDVLDNPTFYLIILTHNFDFYNTIKSRFGGKINFQGNWIANKNANQIELIEGERRGVFAKLRDGYGNCDYTFIACIPFVRNLIEYAKGQEDINYLKLTSVLHVKPERHDLGIKKTFDMKVNDVLEIINSTFDLKYAKQNLDTGVYDLILSSANDIYLMSNDTSLDLKYKICLSIAIRLIAEKFMLEKITNVGFLSKVHKRQTGQIVEQYKIEFPGNAKFISILERVNLMTAENIHVNSFMYEPLMDLSDDHLKSLYNEVKLLV